VEESLVMSVPGSVSTETPNELMVVFSDTVTAGFDAVSSSVSAIFGLMIVIVVALTGIQWALSANREVLAAGFGKVMLIGVFAWLINDWQALSETIYDGFIEIGLMAGGSAIARDEFLNPGSIVEQGWRLVKAIGQTPAAEGNALDVLGNLMDALILAVAMIGIMLSFAVLALQIIVALLEFKIVTLGGFILLPFGIWSKSAFLAERPLGYVVSSGLKVLALAIVVSGARTVFDRLVPTDNPDIYEALALLVAAMLLAMLAISIPNLAAALVTGGPALGAGAAMGGGLAAGGAALLAGGALARAGGAVLGAAPGGPPASRIASASRSASGAAAGRPPSSPPTSAPAPSGGPPGSPGGGTARPSTPVSPGGAVPARPGASGEGSRPSGDDLATARTRRGTVAGTSSSTVASLGAGAAATTGAAGAGGRGRRRSGSRAPQTPLLDAAAAAQPGVAKSGGEVGKNPGGRPTGPAAAGAAQPTGPEVNGHAQLSPEIAAAYASVQARIAALFDDDGAGPAPASGAVSGPAPREDVPSLKPAPAGGEHAPASPSSQTGVDGPSGPPAGQSAPTSGPGTVHATAAASPPTGSAKSSAVQPPEVRSGPGPSAETGSASPSGRTSSTGRRRPEAGQADARRGSPGRAARGSAAMQAFFTANAARSLMPSDSVGAITPDLKRED
jgi:type IV secretion system protein TrbL